MEWFPNGSPKELPAAEQQKRIAAAADVLRPLNIRKREVAIEPLISHMRGVIAPSMPTGKRFVVGGDFNTNLDQSEFAQEKTFRR